MTELAKKIAAEIQRRGAISFARFMELALYCPVYGYYEKEEDNIGRGGDFFTSVSVGSLFGHLLACQFLEWFGQAKTGPQCQLSDGPCHTEGQSGPRENRSAHHCHLIEAGAHQGRLARDVLEFFKTHHPGLLPRLHYWIIEPSELRRKFQVRELADFGELVRWCDDLSALNLAAALLAPETQAVLFCNELLDAFPVHRLGWDARARTWFEWGVDWKQGRFVCDRMDPDRLQVEKWIAESRLPVAELGAALPDGFTIEVCPAASAWWSAAAGLLPPNGKLLAIDYGAEASQLLAPERPQGTLRAYRAHRHSPDPLDSPGEQDLTAHVNFTALQEAGIAAGMRTETFTSQEQFFVGIAARVWNREIQFAEWTAECTRQFQTLTHPEHLGRAFRVLVQSR